MVDETSVLVLANVRRELSEVYEEAVESGLTKVQDRLSDAIDLIDLIYEPVRRHVQEDNPLGSKGKGLNDA